MECLIQKLITMLNMSDYFNNIVPANWKPNTSIIRVIGVGGGGGNAVNQMYKEGMKDVDFTICNTDNKALELSPIPDKVQLGTTLTGGLGAGCDPEQGRNAAIESIDILKTKLDGHTKMVFITAGMGGGTGTGAAPVIAKIAQDMGILTVGVVTLPFKDEGYEAQKRAYDGIMDLSAHVDSLLVIDNQKLYEVFGDLAAIDAIPKADSILTTAVRGIVEIITGRGHIGVDFADIKNLLTKSGMALMGIGEASGEDRAIEAVERAFSSPLLNDYDPKTAKSTLVNITTSPVDGLTMYEMKTIMDYIQEFTGGASNFKRGIVFSESVEKGSVRISVIATGFEVYIAPPPKRAARGERVVLDEEDMDTIILTRQGEGNEDDIKTTPYDPEVITSYTQEMNIADFENESALERKLRKIKEKEERAKLNK